MRKFLTLFVAVLFCTNVFAAGEGELTGLFTINEKGDQIVFSKGNLQYQASSTHTWRFATRQWDFVGGRASASDPLEGNVFENGVQCSNNKISNSYSGWIDLFGWGTGYQPTRTGNPVTAYVDWGANAISNGGNEAYLWHSLTEAEWRYILYTRYSNKQATTYGSQKALIDGVNGYIIFPDDWDKTWNPDSWTLIPSEWQALEDKGAVFLPAGGRRKDVADVMYANSNGNYWTCSENNSTQAYEASFSKASNISVKATALKEDGRSVRLVKVVCTGCKPVHIVTFHAKDGSKYTQREVLDGQTLTVLPSPSSTDDPENIYTFIGWNMNLSKPITSDMDVYPVYEPTEPRRVLTGRFSVSENKQVAFAAGNLQYRPCSYTKPTYSGNVTVEGPRYRIATNQYDVIGVLNVNAQNTNRGFIDLFGFATGNSPIETSKETSAYATGELTGTIARNYSYDWAYRYSSSKYYREEDFANYYTDEYRYEMRLLSAAEWDYLLKTRPNAADLQGHAEVCGVKGYLLLPDDWQALQGISFTPNPVNYTTNVYNQWIWDKMEAAGAVFLPATGSRYGTSVNAVNEDGPFHGYYWTGDFDDASTAKAAIFLSTSKLQVMDAARQNGYAVRPVADCGAWMDNHSGDGIEEVIAAQPATSAVRKVMIDGQIYILRDGKIYTLQGAEIIVP